MNGRYLAASVKDSINVFDMISGQIISNCKHSCLVSCFKWFPNGNSIIFIDENGNYLIWDDVIPDGMLKPDDMSIAEKRDGAPKEKKSTVLIDDQAEMDGLSDDDLDISVDKEKKIRSSLSLVSRDEGSDVDMFDDDLDGFIEDEDGEYARERKREYESSRPKSVFDLKRCFLIVYRTSRCKRLISKTSTLLSVRINAV